MTHLTGIIPPVPTPFTTSGEFDTEALTTLISALEPEVDGFLILGSNGEAALLSEAERDEVVRVARAAIPSDKPLLVGTGGETTRLVIERNHKAAATGADFALIIAPFYFKGSMTDTVLETHYTRVADESPLPVLLYNIPQVTGFAFSPALVAKLAQHENIVGMKDSSGNVMALTETIRQVPDGFTVLTGSAPTLLPALSLGAQGGILAVANVSARSYKKILTCFQDGNLGEARRLQLALNPLAVAVTSKYGVPGLKVVLRSQGKTAGYPRAPLLDVSEDVKQELEGLLEELD
ncbi:dihydrodipicolinate synthase family protein [soil metagenome]